MHNLLQNTTNNPPLLNTVADLWKPNTKSWETDKIALLFGQQADDLIRTFPIARHNRPDILWWKPSKSGKCTSKEAYKHLSAPTNNNSNHFGSRFPHPSAQSLLTKIWKHKTLQPRFKAFAWHLMPQAIATGQRAGRFSNHIDQNCTRCGQLETNAHLFLIVLLHELFGL
jgi:hypothetical protein